MKPFNLVKLTFFFFLFLFIHNLHGQTITLLHTEKVECDDEVRRFEKIGDHFYYEFQNEYRNKENRGIFEVKNNKVYPVELEGLEKLDSNSYDFFEATRLFTMNDYYEISDTSGVFVAVESGSSAYAVFSNGRIIIKELKYENSAIDGLYNYWLNDRLITFVEKDYVEEIVYFDPKDLEFKKLLSDSFQLNFRDLEVFDSLLIGEVYLKDVKEYRYYSINYSGELTPLNPKASSTYYSFVAHKDSMIYYTAKSKKKKKTLGTLNMRTKEMKPFFTLSPKEYISDFNKINNEIVVKYGKGDRYLSKIEGKKMRHIKFPDIIENVYDNEVFWDHRMVFAALDTLKNLRFVLFDVRNERYIVSEEIKDIIGNIMLVEDECFFTTKDSLDHFTLHSVATDGKIHRMDELTFYRRITTLERFRFKNEEYLIIGDERRSNLYKYNPATYAVELVFSNIINTINQGYKYNNDAQANIVVTKDQVYFTAQIGEKFDKFGVYELR